MGYLVSNPYLYGTHPGDWLALLCVAGLLLVVAAGKGW